MKKIISFSLYGNSPKYLNGMLQNTLDAKVFYPDWEIYLYVESDCFENNKNIMNEIIKNKAIIHIIHPEIDKQMGVNWRFYALEHADIFICRDADSRFSKREVDAVNEWLLSDKDFHIMRDHRLHGTKILAGMWGYKGNNLKNIKQLLENYCYNVNYWTLDQVFLADVIYPLTINNAIVHDEYFSFEDYKKPFPSPKINNHFVGQVFTEKNEQVFQ